MGFSLRFFTGVLLFLSTVFAETLLESDKRALLDFAARLGHPRRPLNWDGRFPACRNWTGITCDVEGKRVISVRLPGLGFHSPIPANTISRLSALRVLSLRSNGINGSFPVDFGNLKNLTFLYLQHNNFSGPLLLNFSVFQSLTILNLSDNRFNGTIPSSFSCLNRLVALNLAGNSLSGNVPDLNLPNLELLDLSHNNLVGVVPKSLRRFPKSAFSGNNESLLNYPHYNPTAKNVGGKIKLSEHALLGIVIVVSVLGLLGFSFIFLVCLLRQKTIHNNFPGKLEKGNMSPDKAISRGQDASNTLTFFEGCSYAFDLEDLLRASAEVLGKGTFGTTYRATLEDASTVVVKRLKDVNVGKKEFEQQMNLIGNIRHENVVEMRAYYYSKDEKLMVYDYYNLGSLASMLHGGNRAPLDWETRLNIGIGAAKGIARVHEENHGKLVHGNVKSSNVFLNSSRFGCVSDLGLSTVMNSLSPPVARSAGYRAPEVVDTRKALQASDVYGFGVMLLEMLSGKRAVHAVNGDEVVHLVRWVHSVVREEWTAEVFDVELLRCPNIEEELVEVLQVALGCVVRDHEQRPRMSEVVRTMESVRRVVDSSI